MIANKLFDFLHISSFVDDKTAQKLDGNMAIVLLLCCLISVHMVLSCYEAALALGLVIFLTQASYLGRKCEHFHLFTEK